LHLYHLTSRPVWHARAYLQGWALEKFTALANAIKELRKVNGTCISTKCPLKPVVQNGTH